MQLPLPFIDPPRPVHTRRCPVCGGVWHRYPTTYKPLFTYVMQRQWWYKIGKSFHPRQRLRELSPLNKQRYILSPSNMDLTEPIIMAFVIPGDVEHELHERFAECHVLGEWFDPDDAMREWLDRSRRVEYPLM